MTRSGILKLVGVVIVVVLAAAVYRLLGTVIGAKVEVQVPKVGLTPNQVAAHGPLPGDVGLYLKERACQQKIPTAGYYSSLNGAEIADAQRSGVFPCATFTGSMDGPNQVYAWRSLDDYQGGSYINARKPGELYILGGEYPTLDDPVPAGPYIAKADATTGTQIWRTYLDNANASGWLIGNINLNILDNGNLALAWSNQIVLIDGDTGLILKHNTLPGGEASLYTVNFKHLTIAPDRTLILKDQTRPVGCTVQGTLGIIKCIQDGMKQPNWELVAVSPDTLEVLDMLQLPEPASTPHVVTMFGDRIAIYVGTNTSARPYFWDPAARKLSADDSWAVFPFGPLKPGEFSFAPPKAGADPENGMIYSADMGVGKVAGIRLDQATGEMKVAFVVDDVTSTFQPLIGPKDKRVLLLTNAKFNVAREPLMAALFTGNYTEQLTWRDAVSGKIIAESDFFGPLTLNSLTTPGFGGRIYFPSAVAQGLLCAAGHAEARGEQVVADSTS
jgi:hypothetical protein